MDSPNQEVRTAVGGYCELCYDCRNCYGDGDGWNEPHYNYCKKDLDPVWNDDEEIWAWECEGYEEDYPDEIDCFDAYKERLENPRQEMEGWQ